MAESGVDRKVCNSCRVELSASRDGPCPKCGGTVIGIEKGVSDAMPPWKDSVAVEYASLAKSWKVRSGLLSCAIILTVASAVCGSALGLLWGIFISLALSGASFLVGLWAVTRVEEITRNRFRSE